GALLFTNDLGRQLLADIPPGELPHDRVKRLRIRDLDGQPLTPEQVPSARALQGETVPPTDVLVSSASGTTRRIRVRAHPLRRGHGAYAAVVTWRDVTEETRALADLEMAPAAAQPAHQLHDDFIAAPPHELRPPRQPIPARDEGPRAPG